MDMMENYKRWLGKVTEEDLLTELKAIEGNEEEINDRFYPVSYTHLTLPTN